MHSFDTIFHLSIGPHLLAENFPRQTAAFISPGFNQFNTTKSLAQPHLLSVWEIWPELQALIAPIRQKNFVICSLGSEYFAETKMAQKFWPLF